MGCDILRNLFYKIMTITINFNNFVNNGVILVLMYHEVQKDNNEIESWTVVKQSEFEEQMIYLLKYYTIISLDDALKLVNLGETLHKNYIVITFDDGYSGNYDVVFPIIVKYNIPITIYVSTRACKQNTIYWYDEIINILQEKKDYFIDLSNFSSNKYHIKSNCVGENKWKIIQSLLQDLKKLNLKDRELAIMSIYNQLKKCKMADGILKHLTISEISELSKSSLVTIGAHSHCHNLLSGIPHEMSFKSIVESKQLLEVWTSKEIIHFSYPNGDYDENILAMVRQSGFKTGVTTHANYWQTSDSLFEIPRLGVGRYDSIEKFKFRVMRSKP
jgi:peptidoglycan/xylan/chitin deacetylase (PgdA/CDA1 family)